MKKISSIFLILTTFNFSYSIIKLISFDVGDTLIKMNTALIPPLFYTRIASKVTEKKIDFLQSVQIIKKILNDNPLPCKAISLRNQPDELQKLAPELTQLFIDNWANQTGFSSKKVKLMIEKAFFKLIKNKNMNHTIFNDSQLALNNLKKLDFPMIVISNWTSDLPNLLKSFSLYNYFDTIIASDIVGYAKPKKEIFEIALKTFNSKNSHLNIEPREVLHVGDSQICDINGGNNAGFHTVLIDRKATTPDHKTIINNLVDLPKVIEYINLSELNQ